MKFKIQQFLDYIMEEKGYSTNTLAAYRNDLSQFVEQIESKIDSWEQVDRNLIIDYIMAMKADQEYASSTVARKVAAIKSFFHYLVDHGLLEDDPTATLDSPKVRKRLPKAISAEDLERLLAEPANDRTAKGLRDRALLELLYATGLRVTEVVSLDVEDVNLASSTLRLVRSRDKAERIVPIHDRAIEPLREYMERGRMQLLRDADEQALFLNHRGHRLTRQGLWLIVKHYVREVGIVEDVTPHTLRHTFAAHLIERKANLEYVQEILGHASISTTQVYTQVGKVDSADED
ncbi:MAG: tyrosine recombinase [Anaerolineae bacterium]|jgi:integrase/recombinase XerD|nr:tyrosine recombinase [Anaerolineae bacterium]MDX9830921.1 tyrosine recombinase [Anaerolineae bacterium]